MSKQEPIVRFEDKTMQNKRMQDKTTVDKRMQEPAVEPQNIQQLHYRIDTENCLSHTWVKPVFGVIGSNHHNGDRFFNEVRQPEGRSRWDLMKWLATRKSST